MEFGSEGSFKTFDTIKAESVYDQGIKKKADRMLRNSKKE